MITVKARDSCNKLHSTLSAWQLHMLARPSPPLTTGTDRSNYPG
jgi:hypothetical protein